MEFSLVHTALLILEKLHFSLFLNHSKSRRFIVDTLYFLNLSVTLLVYSFRTILRYRQEKDTTLRVNKDIPAGIYRNILVDTITRL
jgi:hypothetical protein